MEALSYREAEGVALLNRLYLHEPLAIAIDTESTGLRVADGRDSCIGVSMSGVIDGEPFSHYFALAHEIGVNVSRETFDMLKWVLERCDHELVFANVQFDILSLDTVGIHLDHTDFIDICTMAQLVNENKPFNKGVDSLAAFYLSEEGELADDDQKVKDKFIDSEKKSGWHNTTPEMMWDYACRDTELTYRIWAVLVANEVWQELPADIWPRKADLIRVLIAMRRRGVLIDVGLASEMEGLGSGEMERLRGELGMNPASHKDMKALFIDALDMPVLKVSKKTGEPSFDRSVMEEYDIILERLDSPIAKLVKQWRGWQKTVTAAYRPYITLLSPDGRLRCEYMTHRAVTGRLSCVNPNLQQIPKTSDKPWNGKVKECFVARPGYTLVNADFSQLELRLATAYAGEEALKQVFLDGRDIFTEMSKQLGMARHDTKTLVYSMQYGAGINRIVNAFGVSKMRANQIRNNYFNTYPLFKNLADMCAGRVRSTGKVKLWSGRYRHFQYKSEDYKAMNSVIQGGAADIVERIMVRCFKELDNEEECRMLLQVHDSITFEVRDDLVETYIPRIKALMEDVPAVLGDVVMDVKFAVEVGLWVEPELAAA